MNQLPFWQSRAAYSRSKIKPCQPNLTADLPAAPDRAGRSREPDVAEARRIVAAFSARPELGTIAIAGKMVDIPTQGRG